MSDKLSPVRTHPNLCPECGEDDPPMNEATTLCRECWIEVMTRPCEVCGAGWTRWSAHQPPCPRAKPCSACSASTEVWTVKGKDPFSERRVFLCAACWPKMGCPDVFGDLERLTAAVQKTKEKRAAATVTPEEEAETLASWDRQVRTRGPDPRRPREILHGLLSSIQAQQIEGLKAALPPVLRTAFVELCRIVADAGPAADATSASSSLEQSIAWEDEQGLFLTLRPFLDEVDLAALATVLTAEQMEAWTDFASRTSWDPVHEAQRALRTFGVSLGHLPHADYDRLVTRIATAMGDKRLLPERDVRLVLGHLRKVASEPS